MKVDVIYINTHRYDRAPLRACVASVRYWYPDIPVKLIIDPMPGPMDVTALCREWSLGVLDTGGRRFGWGYGKLEPLFRKERHSFLVLDSDTVLSGPVLDQVSGLDADFIVDDEVQPMERFLEIYYNLPRVGELVQDFRYPGYSFNSGQWFGTSGILDREDFAMTIEWSDPPRPKHPDIVYNGDQAHLNFHLHRLEGTGRFTVARIDLMVWPRDGAADHIDLGAIRSRTSAPPQVIHWAGMKPGMPGGLPRRDILDFYEDRYYDRAGGARRLADAWSDAWGRLEKKAKGILSHREKRS